MSGFVYKIPLVEQRLPLNKQYTEKVIGYGASNIYPQSMFQYMISSGVCLSSVKKRRDFVFGNGFVDNNLSDIVVNSHGDTANKLLKKTAWQWSWIDTVCLHINYNSLLEISEIRTIPVEYARICDPESDKAGKIAIWNNWAGEDIEPSNSINNIQYVDKFNPSEAVIMQQIEKAGGIEKWNGQVLYINNEDGFTYSTASFDSVIDDVITDAALARYRKKNIKSGFSASGMIKYNAYVESEAERREIVNNIKGYQGEEEAGNVIVVFPSSGEISDSLPIEFTAYQQNNIDNLYLNQEASIKSRIVGNYNQPRALHTFFDDSGIYNVDLLQNAWRYYNTQTRSDRQDLSVIFEMLFSKWHNQEDLTGVQTFDIQPQTFSE